MRLRSSTSPGGQAATGVKPPMIGGRRPLGRILGIDPQDAERVMARQAETGKLFGETAVELGVISATDVDRAVGEQQGFSVLPDGDERIDPLVVTAFFPDDPLAKSVRELRSTIVGARRKDGGAVQTVALVGLDAASETSILAANLAVACAQAGYRTLLVDANLDRPQQHNLFRASNRTGLTTLLSTNDGGDLARQATAIPQLSLITAGPAVPNAPELLERQRLAQCADQLVDGFDLLVADIANGSGSGIAGCVGLDAAIIVLRRDVSGVRSLQATIDHLDRNGTTVLGTVLTE